MSITIKLDLPDALAAKARAKGLLDPANLTQLIERELAGDVTPQKLVARLARQAELVSTVRLPPLLSCGTPRI